MNKQVMELLAGVRLEELQRFKHIAVFPLSAAANHSPDYLTLAEALELRCLTVTEVSHGGSVPDLRVVNAGLKPVLLLDGEELCGAKQNRVLNTSILVPAGKDMEIPVSCTEQGRWSYVSPEFHESGNVLHCRLRAAKTSSVTDNLAANVGYKSDQGQVWDGIAEMAANLELAPSSTGAMRDAFEAKRADLDAALRSIKLLPEQRGLLVLINGEPAGCDYVSRPAAFARLHGKLVRSYVMDAFTRKPRKVSAPAAAHKHAQAFLTDIAGCDEKQFKSAGLGTDYRYKGARTVGSALLHEQTVIHAAFFRVEGGEQVGHLSQLHRRRDYRIY